MPEAFLGLSAADRREALAVAAAAPFALLHGPQYAWSWRHLILLMLAGAAFGRVRYTTGSTAAATLTHATYNLTFFSAFLVTQNRV